MPAARQRADLIPRNTLLLFILGAGSGSPWSGIRERTTFLQIVCVFDPKPSQPQSIFPEINPQLTDIHPHKSGNKRRMISPITDTQRNTPRPDAILPAQF
jgi:hypothetical protein